jgi:hypothetical protein
MLCESQYLSVQMTVSETCLYLHVECIPGAYLDSHKAEQGSTVIIPGAQVKKPGTEWVRYLINM